MIKQIGIFKDNTDNSTKSVYINDKNSIIEMTLLYIKEDIDVICVPSHYYCNLGCKFCHLTHINNNKKMIPIEIEEFITALTNSLKNKLGKRRSQNKKLLISFMGVGDSLLNLKLLQNLFTKEEYLKKHLNYNYISYAISTIMPTKLDELMKLIDIYEVPIKIHYSLHNPFDSKRYELIPSTTITNLDALKTLNYYNNKIKTNKRIMNIYKMFHKKIDLIEIHYTLIKDINDSNYCLNELYYLLKLFPTNIKFIKFNKIANMEESKNIDKWINTLKELNINIKKYTPPGKNIGSSCGEFTKYFYIKDNSKEFNDWKQKYEIFE